MVLLLPRLPGPAAEILLDELLAPGLGVGYVFDPSDLPAAVRFGATGGTTVDPAQLAQLRERLLRLAKSKGFQVRGIALRLHDSTPKRAPCLWSSPSSQAAKRSETMFGRFSESR